jgi:two-component system chemotaxis sensor kinase CheA
MAADLDMSQYLDLFLQEAEEQLQVLEQETLRLETDPTLDRLNSIFRAAHTLKGSSRAMGYSSFAGLTHEMENLLDVLRAGQLTVTTEVASLLLRCIDQLGEMKAGIADHGSDGLDARALLDELKAIQSSEAVAETITESQALTPEQVEALRIATGAGATILHARFRLREDCVMPFARAFMAITLVQQGGGELLVSLPDTEALEEERFGRDFELIFQTELSAEEMTKSFAQIGEMERYDVQAYAEAPAAPVVEATVPEKAEEAAPVVKREASQTVRVDVSRLDELMNLVGELVIDRTRISQIGAALAAKFELDQNVEALAETVGHISRITSDLQDILLKARMLPIENVFNRLPRAVRDLAQRMGKDISLELAGGETELDRSVIEVLGDPLLHILRNSVDHGIESPEQREKAGKPRRGVVRVSARHQEGHIVVEIADDGKGIDTARVKAKAVERGLLTPEAAERMSDKDALSLIFASGLSTAAEVSDVSGRGVGMDIVRSNIQKLGGLIDVESEPGKGSRFSLRLPLTLAIIRGLLVGIGGVTYVLPLTSVIETLKVEPTEVQTVGGHEVIVLRGSTMPLVGMRELFRSAVREPKSEGSAQYVVVVGLAEQRIGLVVDKLVGEQEVVIKSLSRFCGDVRGISGATILGNGHVALIVDVNGVVAMAREGKN